MRDTGSVSPYRALRDTGSVLPYRALRDTGSVSPYRALRDTGFWLRYCPSRGNTLRSSPYFAIAQYGLFFFASLRRLRQL